ncbi:hypothetical protein FRC11_012202 [Ceratobasidium sp. 423]|nr:hypothetical protein FRC11_012202 [Ceratobasidium sp. 423]
MNSAMDIRRETKDSQLDSRNLKNVRQFNPTKFNADVLDAIKRHKAKYTSTFKDPVPTCDDLSILLHIILKAYLKECWMDRQACKEYLSQHQSLMWKLLGAYLTQEFNTVLQSELPLEQARQVVSRPMPSGGSVNHGLKWAFEQPYRGNTAQLFIKTLDTVRRSYKGASASKRPYNWSIAVVQSSGMGKSRMVDEATKAVFTIPINIREHLPEGKLNRSWL